MPCRNDPNDYTGCADGYEYYYNQCCDSTTDAWVTILIWSSAALLCILCCAALSGGTYYRRRRYRRRQAQYSHFDTEDSLDPYYDEIEPRRQPAQRVVYVQQAPSPNNRQQRSDSDTIRTYTTAPVNGGAPPLPFGMRPLVDTTKSKTTIRITLYTGQTTTLELNETHTVADIHTYVMSVAPTAGSYQLMSGYPPKPLADPSKTIKAAKLQNANVTMRLS